MDRMSVARAMQSRQAAVTRFDLAGSLATLDRRVGLLQYALVGMAHAEHGVAADELAILGELAQEIREGIVTLRLETS